MTFVVLEDCAFFAERLLAVQELEGSIHKSIIGLTEEITLRTKESFDSVCSKIQSALRAKDIEDFVHAKIVEAWEENKSSCPKQLSYTRKSKVGDSEKFTKACQCGYLLREDYKESDTLKILYRIVWYPYNSEVFLKDKGLFSTNA